ncbi:TolC family protein [Lacibacterium aquatile]|uniref:TolC family protein n=1 Tax=Lacibacterium aquatile TaxID=1168082 RepID=A0ABW5DSK6_9PROT
MKEKTVGRAFVRGLGAVAAGLLLVGCSLDPDPMTMESIRTSAAADMAELFTDQEPLTGDIDLPDAMARALKYNVERRLTLMETALASGQLNFASYDLLPRLAASAGYSTRDSNDASFSRNVTTGNTAGEATYSRERQRLLADVGISWNVLDFGVSYIRARQQADRVLIAEERRRKVVQNLMQDVRYAYWRAAAADAFLGRVTQLIARVEDAQKRAQSAQDQKLAPAQDMLAYRRELLDQLRRLERQREQLALARTELATLINLPPNTLFSLKRTDLDPAFAEGHDPQVALPALELLALTLRPELVGERYQARIGQNESYATILSLLPGLDLNASHNFESGNLLLNNSWNEIGARASLNLFRLASLPSAMRLNESREEVDAARRKALSVAVVTQVNLAIQSHRIARKDYERAQLVDELEQSALAEAGKAVQARTATDLSKVRAELAALSSQMALYNSYAELQRSLSQIESSVGIDPLPASVPTDDLAALRDAIEQRLAQPLPDRLRTHLWDTGVLPKPEVAETP